jgi:hypothetical protein
MQFPRHRLAQSGRSRRSAKHHARTSERTEVKLHQPQFSAEEISQMCGDRLRIARSGNETEVKDRQRRQAFCPANTDKSGR